MTDERYAALAAPFDHTFKKPGSNLDYITGEQVASRLNEALGWDSWSFRVLEHGYDEASDEIWVLGQLEIRALPVQIVRQQFGSQKPNRYRPDNKTNPNGIIDLGFDLKGAATDAMKKCASLIGVGLYLHEKELPPGATQQTREQAKPNGSQVPAAAAPPAQPGLYAQAKQYGFDRPEVDAKSVLMFKQQPADLRDGQRRELLLELAQMGLARNHEKETASVGT